MKLRLATLLLFTACVVACGQEPSSSAARSRADADTGLRRALRVPRRLMDELIMLILGGRQA
jgi:hypothetical protein